MRDYDNISFVSICYCKLASTYLLFVNSQYVCIIVTPCRVVSYRVVSCQWNTISNKFQFDQQIQHAFIWSLYVHILISHCIPMILVAMAAVASRSMAWFELWMDFSFGFFCALIWTHTKDNNAIVPNLCAGPTFVLARKIKQSTKQRNVCYLLVFQSFSIRTEWFSIDRLQSQYLVAIVLSCQGARDNC